MNEREECGSCGRTESEGHAPTCPDRPASPAALDDRLRYDPTSGDPDFEDAPLSARLDAIEQAAWSKGFGEGRRSAHSEAASPAAPDHETPIFDEGGLPNSRRFSRAASPAALDVERLAEIQDWLDRHYPIKGKQMRAILAHRRADAASPAALDVRAEVQHALDALNTASDKMMYGDSVEGDLLEAHATLDSLLARLSPPEGLSHDGESSQ